MIGTKLYKENLNLTEYENTSSWCNKNNAMLIDKGKYFEVVPCPDSTQEQSPNLSFILNKLLPVGTVYMTENANFDPNSSWGVGVWEKTAINRVLQGTNDKSKVGTTIDAGLPNITGGIYGLIANNDSSLQGALHVGGNNNIGTLVHSTQDTGHVTIDIDASRSSSIYGSSDTVQPPAELVFIWKRIS